MTSGFNVRDLPSGDRPREKLLSKGVESLTDTELLAILLRTGIKDHSVIQIARDLIKENKSLAVIASKTVEALAKYKGIGTDKAATLAAAFEISRRILSQTKWYSDKKITSPEDVASIFIPLLRDELKEKFIVVSLNSANKIIKYNIISVGSLNASIVHPREVFKVAIDNSSANIILVHNHPSGNPEPSNEDIVITKKICESGKVLDINVFDHVIIAGTSYTSFVEKRLL
jgi:DNA repair protein RadC